MPVLMLESLWGGLNSLAILLAIGMVAGLTFERWRPALPTPTHSKSTPPQLFYNLGYAVTLLTTSWLVTWFLLTPLDQNLRLLHNPQHGFGPLLASLPTAVQVLLALVLTDLAVYLRHRFMHEKMWNVHTIHHSPAVVQWSTKFRLHPMEGMIAMLATYLLLFLFGFSPAILLVSSVIINGFDLLNHVNVRLQFPKPLRYLIASPDYHKWHHAATAKAVNKNYVVMFPFIDLAFGTYYHPDGLPERCGILAKGGKVVDPLPRGWLGQLWYPFVNTKTT